jgi:hypothetical protein
MKNLMLFFALCLSSLTLFGQQQETLFGKSRVVGAFGGPIVEYNFGNDNTQVSVGGGGAVIVGDFFLGGYGMGSTGQQWVNNVEPFEIDLGHGGFWIGGTYPSHKIVHFYSSVKIGWGAIGIKFYDDNTTFVDNVFVLTPEAGLELNVFRWFKIAASANYRWVDGIDPSLSGIDRTFYDGFGANLTFRLGGFGSNWQNWDD